MSGAVIIAQLIGHDRAQAGDIVARSRSPVLALCRALLAAGVNPNSKLECFRGSVLCGGRDFGLIRANMTLRPSYDALKAMTTILGAAPTAAGRIDLGDESQ
jgi:hypothetical protein